METKKCAVCGQSFQRGTEAQRRWDNRKFCSNACRLKSRIGIARLDLRRRFIAMCQACGETFEAGGRTGRTTETMFCSRKCAHAARWRSGSKAKSLTTTEAAYLAGVIDGEGSIFLYKRGGGSAMRITVANTNRDLLEWCLLTTGVGNIVVKRAATQSTSIVACGYATRSRQRPFLSKWQTISPSKRNRLAWQSTSSASCTSRRRKRKETGSINGASE